MHFSSVSTLLILLLPSLLATRGIRVDGCLTEERQALLAFKGPPPYETFYPTFSSWKGQDCCRWAGVVCSNATGRVTQLKLRRNNDDGHGRRLQGEMDVNSLLALTQLNHLDLSGNTFGGIPFPHFLGSFRNLRYLNLSCTFFRFDGGVLPLEELGDLPSLQVLDLNKALDYDSTYRIDNLDWLSRASSLKHLNLRSLNLINATGWFSSVNMLSSLRVLILGDCELKSIPLSYIQLNFTSLAVLDLSYNYFNSTLPKWLWNVTCLKHLDLTWSIFSGTVPDEIRNLNMLEELLLADNQLEGNFVAAALEQMTSLIALDLWGNMLSGSIPPGIAKLSNLTDLYLGDNSFEGEIGESHFENLTRLEWLGLSGNSMTMSVSQSWVPSFQLRLIGLRSCQLRSQFPEWLRFQTRIELLDLSRNEIVGTLPAWFWNVSSASITHIDLSSNQIQGKLPPSLEFPSLEYLYLDSNQFEGPLPAFIPSTLDLLFLSQNSFSFTGGLPIWPHLGQLRLSNNALKGRISSSFCKWKNIFSLDLSNNYLSGEIPYCLGESLGNLLWLELGNNNLYGEIPKTMGLLSGLVVLQLSNNSFSGEFPWTLQNCTDLRLLDLAQNRFTGPIPAWIGESPTWLKILDLRSNTFSGEIPRQLAQLKDLQILDLGDNHLSGSISRSFGRFEAMKTISWYEDIPTDDAQIDVILKGQDRPFNNLYLLKSLDLASNNLTGEIPRGIGGLAGLNNINLSGNHLTGKIPRQIGGIKLLESLDLSRNELSGRIPDSLSQLNFLEHLNLSYNNLSGRIPSGYQLQTLNESSVYTGNPYLCGPPLSNACADHGNKTIQSTDTVERPEWIWLCISIMLGSAVGFWTFLGVLFFNRRWRYSYYRMIDDLCDRAWVQLQLTLRRLHGQEMC